MCSFYETILFVNILSKQKGVFHNMKINKGILIIIMGIILTPVLVYSIGNRYYTRESIYETNWDINIPTDFERIYNGQGKRYTIFVTNELSLSTMMNSEKRENKIQTYDGNLLDGRDNDIEEFVQAIATDLKIPEIHKAQFDEYYEWRKLVKYGNDTLIILYFPRANKVYFVEELM